MVIGGSKVPNFAPKVRSFFIAQGRRCKTVNWYKGMTIYTSPCKHPIAPQVIRCCLQVTSCCPERTYTLNFQITQSLSTLSSYVSINESNIISDIKGIQEDFLQHVELK